MQDKIKEQLEKAFTEEDVIEGMPNKPIEEIIREVAEEEGLSIEEVEEAVEKLANLQISLEAKKRHTKAKRDRVKEKKKKKQAKKAKKRNR